MACIFVNKSANSRNVPQVKCNCATEVCDMCSHRHIRIKESSKISYSLRWFDAGIANCQGNIRKLSLIINLMQRWKIQFLSHLISIYLHTSNLNLHMPNFLVIIHHTFLSVIAFLRVSSIGQDILHLGHVVLHRRYRCIILCTTDANGVMPIPVAMRTACSDAKTRRVGVPYGPSM